MSNFTPAWFKKGFFNESLFCDDFLSTHQLLYSNGAFFTPDGRMVDPMPLRCEIFEMMREYVGANLAKKVTNVVDVLKLAAQVEDFPPVTDRIALANGTLYLDGTFQEGKECTMESIHNYLTYLRMQHCRKALEVLQPSSILWYGKCPAEFDWNVTKIKPFQYERGHYRE